METTAPVSGIEATCPETKMRSPKAVAWAYPAAGAEALLVKISVLMYFSFLPAENYLARSQARLKRA
jgi:hypothetical protein